MEKCGISEDVLIGHICRRIPGTGRESCFLWQAAQLEPAETISKMMSVVERHTKCPFQQEVLDYINQKKIGGKINEEC